VRGGRSKPVGLGLVLLLVAHTCEIPNAGHADNRLVSGSCMVNGLLAHIE
jgi:hypothetical protein